MPFANYNYDNYPVVYVDFSGTINNDDEFKEFINEWTQLYEKNQNFEFIFNTKNIGYVNVKYCMYIALFIKSLKKRPIQYLKKSTINVYNDYIYKLLNAVFYIQKPVALVEIVLYTNINTNTKNNIIIKNKIITP